jgi:site-specific DNA recombinase
MSTEKKQRAVVYARASTQEQAERGLSCPSQIREARELAEAEGFTVVAEFVDDGYSGNETNRPAYQKMLRAARAREFEFIVAHNLDRLWRNEGEQATQLEDLRYHGTHVVTGCRIDTRMGEDVNMLLAVRGAIAAQEGRRTAARVHRVHKTFAIEGTSTGGRSYGIVPESLSPTGERVIDREQAKWVRFIFEKYADGKSPRKIAAELNARGVPSPGATWKRASRRRDAKWLSSTIYGDPARWSGILHNELYRGVMIWNRSQSKKKPRSGVRTFVRRDEKEVIRTAVPHLRIIDDELWNRVRAREAWVREHIGDRIKKALARGASKRDAAQFARRGLQFSKVRYALSGLLKCHGCGASLVITGTHQCYVCASNTNGGRAACANRARLRRTELETRFFTGFAAELAQEKYDRLFEAETRALLRAVERAPDAGKARTRVKELEVKISRLVDAIADGDLVADPAFKKRLADLRQEHAAANSAATVTRGVVEQILPNALKRYRGLVRDLPATAARDPAAGREALREVLGGESIVLRPTRDGGVEAVVSLPLAALLNPANMSSGSGGRI